jgi:hypothetical protein
MGVSSNRLLFLAPVPHPNPSQTYPNCFRFYESYFYFAAFTLNHWFIMSASSRSVAVAALFSEGVGRALLALDHLDMPYGESSPR